MTRTLWQASVLGLCTLGLGTLDLLPGQASAAQNATASAVDPLERARTTPGGIEPELELMEAGQPRVSPDGAWLLINRFPQPRFSLLERATGRAYSIEGTLTGGQGAVFSPDSARVAFKVIQERPNGERVQAPAVLELASRQVTLLADPAPRAGQPVFASSGVMAYTVERTLFVRGALGQLLSRHTLPTYVNWLALSPDGARVVFNDDQDALFSLQLATGAITRIPLPELAFCCPRFSPDGRRLLVSTVDGELWLAEGAQPAARRLGPGDDPVWAPDGTAVVAFVRTFYDERLEDIHLTRYAVDGAKGTLEVGPALPVSPSFTSQGELFFASAVDGRLYRQGVAQSQRLEMPTRETLLLLPDLISSQRTTAVSDTIVRLTGVPFVHQVYDTRDDYYGYGACGATSATMAIAWYDRLWDWDFVASGPYAHTSHYGYFITEIYTWDDFTFDIWGGGSSYPSYGGHGYIWQEPVDTKGNMAAYIQHHDVASSVDWSPTWSKLLAEVDSRQPFVVLSSITSSGHYQTVIGYLPGQHTLYVNDPYGNKNEGYMNHNGAGVAYDWPGYNNGYSNMTAVYCYIYARATAPAPAPGTVADPIQVTGFPYTDWNTTRSSTGSDVLNYYSCASTVDERGRENIYRLRVSEPGTLSASVSCDGESDIDVHLLTGLDANTCLARGHYSFTAKVAPGEYYVTADTWRSSTVEFMGDYELKIDFVPDGEATPLPTPDPTPEPTAVPATPTSVPETPTAVPATPTQATDTPTEIPDNDPPAPGCSQTVWRPRG